jgi:hypothetical protein
VSFIDLVTEHARVRITVSATEGTLLTITRQHPSGRILPVRGMNLVPLSGGAFVGWDYEMPVGVQVTYTAAVYDTTDTNTPLDVSDPATVTWDTAYEWLKDPLEPIRNLPVQVVDMSEYDYIAPTGVHTVLGRPDPITVGDIRQAATGALTLFTEAKDERERLHLLTSSGHVLLLQSTQESGVGNMYIAPTGTLKESRVVSLRDEPSRVWEIDFQEVGIPVGDSAAFVSWQDVLDQYNTWQDVLLGFNSWLEFVESLDSTAAPPILVWRGA